MTQIQRRQQQRPYSGGGVVGVIESSREFSPHFDDQMNL